VCVCECYVLSIYTHFSLHIMFKVFNLLFNQQAQWVKNYQDEVDRLQADVLNIEDISNSLPDGCWKRLQLEP